MDERRGALVIVIGAILAFVILRLVVPRLAETPDEAKYVGVGTNILAGKGLVTIFGVAFPNHSPIWSLVLAGPQVWFGVDGILVGQLVNAASAAALIGLAAALGWRIRPSVGALAAVLLLAFPYLFQLSRTAGLDLPAAAFSVAYIVLGLRAVDRGSAGLGAIAGLAFGVSFLFKETALPFAPVPFLAGLAWHRPWPRLARVAAATALVAAIVLSWWFVLHASITDEVYRLGAPAWTLGPLALVLGAGIVIGFAIEPLLRRRGVDVQTVGTTARWPVVLAWAGAILWVVAQLIVYARAPKLAGIPLVRPSAYIAYLALLPQLAVGLATMLPGSLLVAVAAMRRALDPVAWRELFPTVVTIAANVPLIMLVIGIGETPRHYIAVFPFLAVLGSIGWVTLAERASRGEAWARASLVVGVVLAALLSLVGARRLLVGVREAPVAMVVLAVVGLLVLGGVAWLAQRRGAKPTVLAIVVGTAVLIGGVGIAAAQAARPLAGDQAKQQAVDDLVAWIDANTEPGETVAFSPFLAYEVGQRIVDDHDVVRIRPQVGVVDDAAPLGVRTIGGDPGEVMSIDAALRNVDQFEVIGADTLKRRLQRARPAWWAHATLGEGAPPVTSALDAAEGLEPAETWSYPYGEERIHVTMYRVDPDGFTPADDVTFVHPLALERIVTALEAGSDPGPAARSLLGRARLQPPGSTDTDLLTRLEALGAR